jgi:hypothetical protein
MSADEKLNPVLRANSLVVGAVMYALPTAVSFLGGPVGKGASAAGGGFMRDFGKKLIHEGWTGEMDEEQRERYRRIMAGDESACGGGPF